MGRYAFFSADNGETVEYTFWSAIQESYIPWVENKTKLRCEEYDEDQADDYELTEEQREIWRGYEGEEVEHFTPETEFLKDFCVEEYYASDDGERLAAYWKRVYSQAKRLRLTPFRRNRDEDLFDTLDTYVENVIDVAEKGVCENHKRRLADLHLKLHICCFLQKHGSYSVDYES